MCKILHASSIEEFSDIEKIEKQGDEVGDYSIQNKIVATINNNKNVDIV